MSLLLLIPVLSEVEAFSQCLKDTASDSIENIFFLSLGQLGDLLGNSILTLLKLLVGEMKEVLVCNLEHVLPLVLRESSLEISTGESSNLRHGVEERTVPEGEDTLQMGSKSTLGLANERSKGVVGVFSHLFVMFIDDDSTEVIQEESEKALHFVGLG